MSWSVSVERDGYNVVTLSSNGIGGRELSAADEEAVRTAAQHLLAFVGDPPAARPPAPGWQPIESAPSDMRVILVAADQLIFAAYRSQRGCFLQCGSGSEIFTPTHWMPLPASPRADAPDETP